MTRYIDADKLKERIGFYCDHTTESCGEHYAYNKAFCEIERMPTADVVEVKHGENIGTLHPVDEFICSECGIVLEGWTKVVTDEDDGEMYFYEYEFKYCPNCGARMDGGGRE